MKRQKGFTLIELLVVIAIIGILSAIVLASLNSARNRAQDSKVQSQLANMRAAAEIYYGTDNLNSYGTSADCTGAMFADVDPGMVGLAAATTDIVCGAADSTWAAAAPYVSDSTKFWCVDSSGKSKLWEGASAPADNLQACE